MSVRIVLVDTQGKISRFPLTRYDQLLHPEMGEAFPECAGDWARFAEGVVKVWGRRSVRIARITYHRLKIEADGRPDPAAWEDSIDVSVRATEAVTLDDNLLHGSGIWARKRLHEQYKWRPTGPQEKEIRRLLLKG